MCLTFSDFVNGALNKLRSTRTPSFTPQPERISKYLLCYSNEILAVVYKKHLS